MKPTQDIKVAVDAVVFGYTKKKLQILLIQQKFGTKTDQWALPGGFVKDNETLEDAVTRELNEETGVSVNYLEQLFTFGALDRDPRARTISVSYMILVNPKNFILQADTDADKVQWFDVKDMPKLAFDHNKIVDLGLERLRSKIHYRPIGFQLLNNEFPFSDLENLYQTVLNKKVDRRNFRKKLMSFGFVLETDKIHRAAMGRPARLFTFDESKYKEMYEKGMNFEVKLAY